MTGEKALEVQFDVKMTRGVLQDYMLHNGYNKPLAIVVNVMGILMFVSMFFGFGLGTGFIGLVILLYIPVVTWSRASKIMKKDRFQEESFIMLNDNGITKVEGNETKRIDWENVSKAVSTRKSIIVFTEDQKACIFPRKDMGEKTAAVIQAISTHVSPDKIKIRA